MNLSWNLVLLIAERIVDFFWKSRDVKEFVVHLLERYAKSTETEIDDMVVDLVRKKLLG
jgi:hypothetical protein